MRYFANPSTSAVREAMATTPQLGAIATPRQGHTLTVLAAGVAWCADNGCFGTRYPGDEAWLAWLGVLSEYSPTCAFATAPDVVGDAQATLQRSTPWLPRIRALGYPAALVAQDGLTPATTPWADIDALFIGGTTEWKLGPEARTLTTEAKARGLHVHMGRVNTARRYRYAAAIGCDSADGTTLAKFPSSLPIVLGWLSHHATSPTLDAL